jgi:hypothetical protein
MKKITIVVLASIMTLSGCATPPGGPDATSNTNSAGANAASGALVGAVAGCGLALLLNKKCANGALAGGLIGAAIGWSSTSKKTASAQQVNEQSRRAGIMVPVNEVRVRDYALRPASTAVRGGSEMKVIGDITLIGQSAQRPELVQTMILINPDGSNASDKPQQARVEAVDGAGQYQAINTYKIPKGMPQGQYRVSSTLTLNGREVSKKMTGFQVAYLDGKQTVRMASL